MAPAVVRRAPYKNFLQPALHRRFATTAAVLLGIAYLQAIRFASWSSFIWPWFPLGPAGFRTAYLFGCGVWIIVLRVAQYHVGLRTSNSRFQTFAQHVLKLETVDTVLSYTISAWFFSQFYIWSVPSSANLKWILYQTGDRARLNEKALFFTVYFIIFGLAQAIQHLYNDTDRLALGTVNPRKDEAAKEPGSIVGQLKRFVERLPSIAGAAATQALWMPPIGVLVYGWFVRSFAWHTVLGVLRHFFNLPRTNMLPLTSPWSIWVLVRCAEASFMLSFAWMISNSAFSIFLVKEPIKNGLPLTSESKDPNGSLLNGLKSKKLAIQGFAMWELAFIARDFEARRKAIFEDLDRKDGLMWSQTCTICLDAIKGMESRIDKYGKPAAPAPAASAAVVEDKKRMFPPPKNDQILISTPPKKSFHNEVEKAVGHIVRNPGQLSTLSPVAKKAAARAQETLLAVQKKATGVDDPGALVRDYSLRILKSPVGIFFRQEYRRRLNAVVLGSPYGEPSLYINSINALSRLAVSSLSEDKYGNVQRDVATIVRAFTAVASKLRAFRDVLPGHWTDVVGKKESPEIDAILEALSGSLGELVEAFGQYSRDLRLTTTDMRLAREAAGSSGKAGRTQEMAQT